MVSKVRTDGYRVGRLCGIKSCWQRRGRVQRPGSATAGRMGDYGAVLARTGRDSAMRRRQQQRQRLRLRGRMEGADGGPDVVD